MSPHLFLATFALSTLAAAVPIDTARDDTLTDICRAIPGDSSWPSQSDWDSLNQTVGGNLIATIPIAAPCHNTLFGQPNLLYDEGACDKLRNEWYYPGTHLPSPSSPMAYPFSNNSCNPFLPPDSPCTIGYHVAYAIDATGAEDFQTAIQFSKDHNIRLVIRNTGHDYLGKSTGAHALEIWTHHMKAMELLEVQIGSDVVGPVIKLGAGVETTEAYTFADSHGLMVVGGNCPTVGIAGGYTQGGGHGPLSSKLGLAADNVVEWEVVTGTGELVIANAVTNPDLFWALRGGGGATYGVVVSMTVKAFPDTFFSTASMTVPNNGTNGDALYSAVGTFLQTLPALVDSGAIAIWVATPVGFMLSPAIAPGLHPAELDTIFQPAINKLDELGLEYNYSSSEIPCFLSTFSFVTTIANVSDYNIGGRLIPRALVEDDTEALVEAIRYISSKTIISGNTFDVSGGVASPDDVAANPYFRETLFSATLGTAIDYTDFAANGAAQDQLTLDLLPQLEALTPDGAAYLNEADFQQPDFKTTFYGDHYERLLQVKDMYDPEQVFYATTAVGSDRWEEQSDGRLCKV